MMVSPRRVTAARAVSMLTTRQLADHFGISPRVLLTRARRRGVKPVGTFGSIALAWPDTAKELLAPRASGAAGHARNLKRKGRE